MLKTDRAVQNENFLGCITLKKKLTNCPGIFRIVVKLEEYAMIKLNLFVRDL